MGEHAPDAIFALGLNIRKIRQAQRYTQVWLADKAHISKQMMHKIEAGLTDPRATILARIALALGVTTDALLGLPGARLPRQLQDRVEGL